MSSKSFAVAALAMMAVLAAAPAAATGGGLNGLPSLFALVGADGFVAPDSPGGITQDNVLRVDTLVGERIDTHYCFFGLPPVTSGQVTLQGVRAPSKNAAELIVESEETADDGVNRCSVRVYLTIEGVLGAADFHVLLY